MLLEQGPLMPTADASVTFECVASARWGYHPSPTVLARRTMQAYPLALWWLRLRAEQLATQLPPRFAQAVRAWHADADEHRRVRHLLALGEPYALPIDGGDAEHLLTARPLQPPVDPRQAVTR
ncbi:hypothetical protein [Kitasatospora sp. NPDC057541]|uniref:hypothetical protein n=1 Tax=unclassified Kitasatospora TaxID=2633591 RepID=UPI0036AFEF51